MKIIRKALLSLSLFVLVSVPLLTPGCNYLGNCADTTEYPVNARLSSWVNGKALDSIPDSLYVYVIRPGTSDSLVYDSITTNLLSLPLNPQTNLSSFIFEFLEASDTLYINHHQYADLVSYDCGLTYIYIIDSISFTGNVIDSVALYYPQTNTELLTDEENIRIYF